MGQKPAFQVLLPQTRQVLIPGLSPKGELYSLGPVWCGGSGKLGPCGAGGRELQESIGWRHGVACCWQDLGRLC